MNLGICCNKWKITREIINVSFQSAFCTFEKTEMTFLRFTEIFGLQDETRKNNPMIQLVLYPSWYRSLIFSKNGVKVEANTIIPTRKLKLKYLKLTNRTKMVTKIYVSPILSWNHKLQANRSNKWVY